MKNSSSAALLILVLASWQGHAQQAVDIAPVAGRPSRHLCKVNVCFAFDESSSVGSQGFRNEIIAARTIARALGSGSIYSAVQYTNRCRTILRPTSRYFSAVRAISGNTLEGGATRSSEGLKCCGELLAGRPGPNVVVLLTDGQDAADTNTQAAAASLKPDFTIVTVNVGNPVHNPSLESLATDPSLAVEFGDHVDLVKEGGPFDEQICSEPCCERAKICYAIDESGSIPSEAFTAMTNGILAVTSSHNAISGGSSEYGAVGFGSSVQTITPTVAAENFYGPVESNTQAEGGTPIASALRQCAKLLRSQPTTPGVPLIIVLFSDGSHSFFDGNPVPVANSLSPPIRFISVGIGNFIDAMTLGAISSPNAFINLPSFDAIYKTVGNITNAICESRNASETPVPPAVGPVFQDFVGCTRMTCSMCPRRKLQCFIRSGSAFFDDLVKKDIAGRGKNAFNDAVRKCGFNLDSRRKRRRTSLQLFESEIFGQYFTDNEDSAVCRDGAGNPSSFISINVCRSGGDSPVGGDDREVIINAGRGEGGEAGRGGGGGSGGGAGGGGGGSEGGEAGSAAAGAEEGEDGGDSGDEGDDDGEEGGVGPGPITYECTKRKCSAKNQACAPQESQEVLPAEA